jgi:hypothetical protein
MVITIKVIAIFNQFINILVIWINFVLTFSILAISSMLSLCSKKKEKYYSLQLASQPVFFASQENPLDFGYLLPKGGP